MKQKLALLAAILLVAINLRGAEPFFFVQLADPQFGMFTENKNLAQETANLEFAVATINRLRPAFVVVCGDILNKPGDPAQFAAYKRVMSRIAPGIPVYALPGNHDIGNAPSARDIATYTNLFGPDYYTFRHGGMTGIVLNSVIIHTPTNAVEEFDRQEAWLQKELKEARQAGGKHIVIFGHHPWFLESADEPNQYFNIPGERRARYLGWFREAGVKYLFSGHYHRNAGAVDGGMEAITSGPVGKPLAEGVSGLRIVIVRDDRIEHRFYHFGEIPNQVNLPGKRGK